MQILYTNILYYTNISKLATVEILNKKLFRSGTYFIFEDY